MIKEIVLLTSIALFFISGKLAKDAPCADALKTMKDSEKYAGKAESSKSWDGTQSNLKKAMKLNKSAAKQAEACGCEEAKKIIDDALSKSKKGYKSDKWEDTQRRAKQAGKEAKDAIKELEKCVEAGVKPT